MSEEIKSIQLNESAYIMKHPDKLPVLQNAVPKNSDEPPTEVTTDAPILSPVQSKATPDIPSSFLLWVDVNMSIMLKTKDHPEGEWVTLWCDDEPSPSESEGKYWFWAWWKKSWNHNQDLLKSKGIPILKTEYCLCAPCSIAIPYHYVVQDPYRR